MATFLDFINEDIEAKRALIATLPTKTKANIKSYNLKMDEIARKYQTYEDAVEKYLLTKARSFEQKPIEKKIDAYSDTVDELEHVAYILNPTNSYIEKMGFDDILFELRHYLDFSFSNLNEILGEFLDKFEQAGINLEADEFDTTFYVHEYLSLFIESRLDTEKDYTEQLEKKFEEIYWVNPEIVGHIELNLRKIINRYESKFNSYIGKLADEIKEEYAVYDYNDCLNKIAETYDLLDRERQENICDVIDLCKAGTIDLVTYFTDSKVRSTNYESLMLKPIDMNDSKALTDFYDTLRKLRTNIIEYQNYLDFLPIVESFKESTKDLLETPMDPKARKELDDKISKCTKELEKINKKIENKGLFKASEERIKSYKMDSIKKAKELYDLTHELNNLQFRQRCSELISPNFTVQDFLHLYYSYDYFKKNSLMTNFKLTKYEDLEDKSDKFDEFAMRPTNIILAGVSMYSDEDIAQVIANKFQIENINLDPNALTANDLELLLDKIAYLLRIEQIANSPLDEQKVWFLGQAEKITKAKAEEMQKQAEKEKEEALKKAEEEKTKLSTEKDKKKKESKPKKEKKNTKKSKAK